MAKKVRKPRSSSPRTYGQPGATSKPAPAPVPANAVEPKPSPQAAPAGKPDRTTPQGTKAGRVDFAAEYRYVAGDLRRMFVLAGVMLVLLIALNFILQ